MLDADAVRRYPDPQSVALRAKCAEVYGYPGPEWVVAGNGMDEILAMTVRTFVDPGALVVSVHPTYSLYETIALLHGARFETYPLDTAFQPPEALYTSRARLCFLPRPNAPTGVSVPCADVRRLCKTFHGLIVIDEAYADFAEDSCMAFARDFDNVIVARTFSKGYSLAGLRLGIGVAQPDLIREFAKTKDSYNVNAVTQAAGLAAVSDQEYLRGNVAKIRVTRQRLTERLRELRFAVPDSQSNFVLATRTKPPLARDLYQALRDRDIFVRYFDTPGLQDSLRITVGTDDEINTLLAALTELLRA